MAGRGASGKIKELNVPEKACFDSAQVLRQKKKKKKGNVALLDGG